MLVTALGSAVEADSPLLISQRQDVVSDSLAKVIVHESILVALFMRLTDVEVTMVWRWSGSDGRWLVVFGLWFTLLGVDGAVEAR